MGPDWLTKALHRAKTLPEDNRIVSRAELGAGRREEGMELVQYLVAFLLG